LSHAAIHKQFRSVYEARILGREASVSSFVVQRAANDKIPAPLPYGNIRGFRVLRTDQKLPYSAWRSRPAWRSIRSTRASSSSLRPLTPNLIDG
jgi:hypothetical protein